MYNDVRKFVTQADRIQKYLLLQAMFNFETLTKQFKLPQKFWFAHPQKFYEANYFKRDSDVMARKYIRNFPEPNSS